jgi:protein ImuB
VSAGVVRVLAVWSPDWPVTAAARAAHVPPHHPAAVVVGNRVLACSAVARAQGVRRGLRRREAQARCPELALLARDPDRDARAFEPVVVAVEELAPGVEIVRPGLLALPARGPVGWFGGEQAAAERLVDQVAARTGVECQVGVADGLFAAVLAARRGVAVGAGDTRAFLAPLGVEELDRDPEVDRSALVDLLRRLGLRSLGAFGALDADRGLDPRPPVRRRPPEELAVEIELDPPVDRVDAAAFAARGLATALHRTLAGHGLSCTRLGIVARTTDGEELHRIWRCAEPLTPSATVDRVRWQLDSWLTATRRLRSSPASAGAAASEPRSCGGGVRWLRLVPEETVTAGALQLGLWGETGEADARAGRAMVRVQALLGPESVVTGVLVGGREPGEQVRLVPWGDERPPGLPAAIDGPRATAGSGTPGGPGAAITAMGGPAVPAVPPAADHGPAPGAARALRPATAPDTVSRRPAHAAPAGWPDDVVRTTGRVSAADLPVAGGTGSRPRPTNARRRLPARPALRPPGSVHEPPPSWPGRVPAPSPATVPPAPLPAELLDAAGRPVTLSEPDLLTAAPHRIAVDGGPPREVRAWAGPWPSQQRWWLPDASGRARLQVALADGTALLLTGDGRWWVTGVYD